MAQDAGRSLTNHCEDALLSPLPPPPHHRRNFIHAFFPRTQTGSNSPLASDTTTGYTFGTMSLVMLLLTSIVVNKYRFTFGRQRTRIAYNLSNAHVLPFSIRRDYTTGYTIQRRRNPELLHTVPVRAWSRPPYTSSMDFSFPDNSKGLRQRNGKGHKVKSKHSRGNSIVSFVEPPLAQDDSIVDIKGAKRLKCDQDSSIAIFRFTDTMHSQGRSKVYARKSYHTATPVPKDQISKIIGHPHIFLSASAYGQMTSMQSQFISYSITQPSLKDYLANSTHLDTDNARAHTWFGCISSALSYIHSKRIQHADIKPENILVRGSNVLLSDFGLSRAVSEPDSTTSSISPSTPLYASPEIAGHLRHGRKADVFSLGCVTLELLTVSQGKSLRDLHQYLGLIRTRKRPRGEPAYWKVRNPVSAWVAIRKTMAISSTQRLWDMCLNMLEENPNLRPSAVAVSDAVSETLASISKLTCQDHSSASSPSLVLAKNLIFHTKGRIICNTRKSKRKPVAGSEFGFDR